MPETFTFEEVLEPESFSFEDLQEVTPVGSSGMGDLKMAERKQEKALQREALLSEMEQVKSARKANDRLVNELAFSEQVVEPFTASGMLNQPSRIVRAPDPFKSGTPVVDLPEPKGESAMSGVGKLTSRFVEGLTTPENLVTLAGAGGSSTGSALVRGLFGGEMAKHLPEQSAKLGETFGDTGSTPSEKVLAVGEPALSTAMIGLLSKHSNVSKSSLPKSSKVVEEKLKVEAPGESRWSKVPRGVEKEIEAVEIGPRANDPVLQPGIENVNKPLSQRDIFDDLEIKRPYTGNKSVEGFYREMPDKRPSQEKLPGEIEISEFELERPKIDETKIETVKEESAIEPVGAEVPNNAQRAPDLLDTGDAKVGQSQVTEPEIVGMGGAVPGEFTPPKQFKTSNKNEVVDRERVELGLEPAMQPLRHTFQEAWDEAMARMDENPRYQDELIADLKENPRGLKDDVENAVVLHRRADLKNEQAKIAREMSQAFEDGRLEDAKEAQVRFDRITEEIEAVSDITKTSGSINARTLNARKMMVDQDFTLSSLVMQKRAAKGGKPLTPQETIEVQKIADEYKAKVEAAEKSLAEKDQRIADLEAQKAFERIKAETKPSNYVIQIAEKIVSALDKRATAARERLKAKFARTSSGVDPTILLDLAEIGASHIGHFGLDFVKWSAKMTEEFGENVKPYLEEAYKSAQKIIDDQATKFGGKKRSKEVTETIKKTEPKNRIEGAKVRVAKGEKVDLGMLAHQLARDFVKQGVKTRDELINLLHPALQQIDPKITRLETAHAVSGYGKFKKLSREEVDVTLRDLKGQLQQISKLEDMQSGKAPEKTGVERRTPSDEERRLIKQVEEAKRKGGYKVTDPATQLKSALDAVKTRLRNAITDLETQIESKTKIVKKKTDLKYDAEANALKAKRDELQKEFDDIFGKRELTDEQRTQMAIRAVERTIADYEKKLSTGDISPLKKPSVTKETPALKAARARRDALKEQLQELREIANPKKTPEQRALQSFKTRTSNKIADLEERLAKGDFSKKKPVEYTKDKEAVDLQFEVERVKRKWNEALYKEKLKNRTPSQRAADAVKEALFFQKAWKTAFDLSAIFRQGGFVALGNPIRTLKIMPDMFRAMKSEKEQFRIEEEIRNRPNAPLYKEAGLFLSGHADTLTKMEEAYLGRWAEKVPLVSHSARAYTTFLNRLRADSFDALVASLTKDGKPTKPEVKAIANFVNVATGRGSVGPTSNMGVTGFNLFFAPRYVVSRFQLLGGQPLYRGSAKTRKLVAQEYAKFLIGLSVVYGLAKSAGGEIETDVRSPDYGKIRIGDNVIDPLSGLSQQLSFVGRMGTGEKVNTKTGEVQDLVEPDFGGPSIKTEAERYVRSKLSPAAALGYDVLNRKGFDNQPLTTGKMAETILTPINVGDVYEIMKDNNIPAGIAYSIINTMGMGVSSRKED